VINIIMWVRCMGCYRNILGKSAPSIPLIELNVVYPNQVDLSSLSRPFGEEILKALKDIPRDKSPGRFGSSFYRDYWNTIKSDIMDLFHQFYDGNYQVERSNRSYIVLIKKKEDSCTPDAYRPISLLNCSFKLITKVLAIRLQSVI
jgi:hypothetical protein